MQQILVYGDSLSWGLVPDTRQRFSFDQRWPGILELELSNSGNPARVIEDCLNGRRTVWDDPYKPGRNGGIGLAQRIEINSPLALVILLLGINDFQSVHQLGAWESAQGLRTLISAIRQSPIEPTMPIPPILVVAPPKLQKARGTIAPKFKDAESKAIGLNEEIKQAAIDTDCYFLDASTVTQTSRIDGVHLDIDQHLALGKAVAEQVKILI